MSSLTRRTFVMSAGAGFVSLATPVFAITTDQSRSLINRLVNEINAVINSGKSESSMYKDFEKIFSRYADVSAIGRSSLGPAARSASSSELQAYTSAFQGYISRKYGKRFREFIGGKIEVKDARKIKTFYEVQSLAHIPGKQPFDVRWHVSDRSGRDLFFNIIIEGVNMIAVEREEIGALLDKNKGSISSLTNALKKSV